MQTIVQFYENSLGTNQHFHRTLALLLIKPVPTSLFWTLSHLGWTLRDHRGHPSLLSPLPAGFRQCRISVLPLVGWKQCLGEPWDKHMSHFQSVKKCGWIDGWSCLFVFKLTWAMQYGSWSWTMCGQEWEDWFIWVTSPWDVPCSHWKHSSEVKMVLKCTAEGRGLSILIIPC